MKSRSSPPVTLVVHGLSDLDEASNVATGNQAGQLALLGRDILLGRLETSQESVLHDILELVVDLLLSPSEALAVLRHLQTRHGDTTAVGGLSGSIPNSSLALVLPLGLEQVNGLLSTTHVGSLSNNQDTASNEGLGLSLVDLVLGRRGQRNVHLADVNPGSSTVVILELVAVLEVRQGPSLGLERGDLVDVLRREGSAVGGDERAVGVGQRDDGGAKLDTFQSRVLRDISGAGDGDTLAGERTLAGVLEHVLDVVDEAVAGSLCFQSR